MTTRDAILARLVLAERDEESIPLGTTVRLRELTRLQLREASAWSTTTDMAERERTRGARLALAVAEADGDADALRAALTTYYLGVPTSATDVDRWHAALFAAGALGDDGAPLFTRDEILAWPNRAALWDEVRRLAQAVLDLSDVGDAALKNESAPSSPTTA